MTRAVSIVLVALVLVAAGCTGDEPTPVETGAGEAKREVAIYLVRAGKVAPVRRVVDETPQSSAGDALDALLTGPTDAEQDAGYTTSLPIDESAVLGVSGETANVSISPERRLPALASAQLVHTLTQFAEVKRVVVDDSKPLTRKAFEDVAPQILIESPLDGDVVRSPIRLRGTANVFEATVSIEVRDGTGTVVLEAFTTATSGTGTRGTFDTELVLPGATGTMTIVAFESSAKDGTPLHATDVQVSVAR